MVVSVAVVYRHGQTTVPGAVTRHPLHNHRPGLHLLKYSVEEYPNMSKAWNYIMILIVVEIGWILMFYSCNFYLMLSKSIPVSGSAIAKYSCFVPDVKFA